MGKFIDGSKQTLKERFSQIPCFCYSCIDMKNSFYKRDLISIEDLSEKEINQVLDLALKLKQKARPKALSGLLLASLFFEPSTRTRLSFEAAMLKLGGNVIGFSDDKQTSTQKGESLTDSIKMAGSYADILILRHSLEGAALLASEKTDVPVINAGDGANQHPTQTLLDLFTIRECQKKIHNLNIALIGDLKHARTAHSLAMALSHFKSRIYFVCPEYLMMPEEICFQLKQQRVRFSFHDRLETILPKCDILYVTRLQKERFQTPIDILKPPYAVRLDMMKKAKKSCRILHPLPRVSEIEPSIDDTEFAYYFEQAKNGLFLRQALLLLTLKNKVE